MKGKLLKVVLIGLGSLSWILTVIKSGMLYHFGLGFWGANGHDGVWHVALIQSLARGSFDMPAFAGEKLKNYHIGFDLIVALIARITTIPASTLYFQLLPPVLAVLTGILIYRLVFTWTKSQKASLWSVFFVYFGGSFGFLIGRGESAFWSQQAISTLINPPFALSLIVLLSALILLAKKKDVWAAVLFGLLIEIKAYSGILALGSLLMIGIWQVLKEKKFNVLLVFGGSLVISVVLFLPLNSGSGGLLVFKPFWFLETMMGLTDRIGWQKFYSAMVNYRAGGVWKWVPAYAAAFALFWIGNLGTRIVKDLWILKQIRKIRDIDFLTLFSFSVIVAGVAIPMVFLQKGTPWNTIQFFYYSLFFSSILAGVAVARIKSKLVLVGIALLTVPTSMLALKDVYLPVRPPAMISTAEIQALNFLAKQETGIVLTYPFDEAKAKEAETNPPRPLYLYVSTAYVSAYANKPAYLEDEVNLNITGYDWEDRRRQVIDFITAQDGAVAKKFLKDNNIRYLYLVKAARPLVGERLRLGESQLGLSQIFENREVEIYRVN